MSVYITNGIGFSEVPLRRTKMLKLSFTTLGCPDWTLRQIVGNAVRMGYDAVDFRGLQENLDISTTPAFTTDIEATHRMFADAGLAISGIATSARYAVVDATELQANYDETRRNMDLAAKLGVKFLRVYGGRVPEGHTVDSILPTLIDNLRPLVMKLLNMTSRWCWKPMMIGQILRFLAG